jgi:large subunit ribosomal protein L25
MSGDAISLEVTKREVNGKKVKVLRRDGFIPAVVYERGKESVMLSAAFIPLTKVWSKAGKHHLVELNISGKKQMAIIKDVDIDPRKGVLTHVAFHAVKMDEAIHAEIPVKIIGDIPAERLGYFLVHPVDHIEVKALPGDLPDVIEISGENLENVGDNLLVSQLVAPKGVEILTEGDRPVAMVEESRAQIEAEQVDEGEAGEEEAAESSDSTDAKSKEEE